MDHAMTATSRRRAQFPKLKSWRRNRNGNWQITLRKFRVTIFQTQMGWGAVIGHANRPDGVFTRERFSSFALAQLAAFDMLDTIERKVGRR